MSDTITCDCSEEYGPCEEHCTLLVSRELAGRGGDDLALTLIHDLIGCGAEVSPWGKDRLAQIEEHYEVDPVSGIGRFEDPDIMEMVTDLSQQLESNVADLVVIQDDGYRILKPSEDCPLYS